LPDATFADGRPRSLFLQVTPCDDANASDLAHCLTIRVMALDHPSIDVERARQANANGDEDEFVGGHPFGPALRVWRATAPGDGSKPHGSPQ
jgi:hypothetical protein